LINKIKQDNKNEHNGLYTGSITGK
jgi:hypothetical protein